MRRSKLDRRKYPRAYNSGKGETTFPLHDLVSHLKFKATANEELSKSILKWMELTGNEPTVLTSPQA